jgi:hypothetical protein
LLNSSYQESPAHPGLHIPASLCLMRTSQK